MALKLVVTAIAGVILIAVLKNSSSVYSVVARIALICLIVLSIAPQMNEIINMLHRIEFNEYFSSETISVMLKMFAILTIGSVASDICRDNGENAVANGVDLSVKILAISCGLPVFSAVINVAISFFNG